MIQWYLRGFLVLYCPSCSQTYSSSFKRCPECHGWLKSEEKTAAKAAQITSGWSAPPPEIVSNVQDVDLDYGWHADSVEPEKKKRYTVVEESWVDEEIGGLDLRDSPTIVARHKSDSGAPKAALSGVLLICLVALAFFGLRANSSSSGQAESDPHAAVLQEAEMWLRSADESQQSNDFGLAAIQLEKALGLLEKGQAERPRIVEARVALAKALRSDGNLEAAHKEWSSLVGIEPQARKAKATLEKELRVKANGLLKESAAARDAGEYKTALVSADRAQELYKTYGGSQTQLARSLEASARASLADSNLVAAESKLQVAQKFEWSLERANLLARITPKSPVRFSTTRPSRRPSIGKPSKIPQAERPLEPEYPTAEEPATVSAPVAVPVYQPSTNSPPAEAPIHYQPPPNSPAYNTTESQSEEQLGKEGVLESYQSSGSRTGKVRGY
jgi:tetratricopeptide (TPR) repeat protein